MELAAAALAGFAARLICHPLDTIKTVRFTGFASVHKFSSENGNLSSDYCRTASGSTSSYSASRTLKRKSIWLCAQQIWMSEGIRGFYRGVGVAVAGSAPGVALYLSSYHFCQNYLSCRLSSTIKDEDRKNDLWEDNVSTKVCPSSSPLRPWIAFVSGLFAEAVSCAIWVPVDVTKERLQSQPRTLAGRYRNSRHALHTIIRLEGVKGLYKGYFSTLGSFGPFSGVYFVVYEYCCDFLSCIQNSSIAVRNGSPTLTPSAVCEMKKKQKSLWVPLLSGICATTVAGICCNPLELVKTRLQVQRTILANSTSSVLGRSGGIVSTCRGKLTPSSTRLFSYQYRGLIDGITQMIRNEGILSLWRGTVARVAFQAPNAALTMAFYEFLVK